MFKNSPQGLWRYIGRYMWYKKIHTYLDPHKKTMPLNAYGCCATVRDLCKSHRKCSTKHHCGHKISGQKLVDFCTYKKDLVLPSTCVLPSGFDLNSEYPVCRTLHYQLVEYFSSARVLKDEVHVEDTAGRKVGTKKNF